VAAAAATGIRRARQGLAGLDPNNERIDKGAGVLGMSRRTLTAARLQKPARCGASCFLASWNPGGCLRANFFYDVTSQFSQAAALMMMMMMMMMMMLL